MKLSFTRDSRLHLMEERARLHHRLRFRIVLHPLIAPPSLSATGNFLLLLSCLSTRCQTHPSTSRNRNHDARLDHLQAFLPYGHDDLPLLLQQLDQGAKARQEWNRDFVFRSKSVGTGLRIRHRDLHPFGCYVIGHLPRELPEVADTTHSDSCLEGAFLGWDVATLTVWIWSFRKKEPVRMHDPVFYRQKFPFLDPSVLLNREISLQDIELLRAGDS